MVTLPPIERIGDTGIVRPTGQASIEDAVALVTAAIVEARRLRLTGLVVAVTGLSGFGPPSVAVRHAMVREWAHAAEGRLRVALVVPPDFIDPAGFGVVAAANFGLAGNPFETEAAALDWLRDS